MLGLTKAGQVGVEGGDGRAAVAEVVLDLAEVLAAFEQVRGVRVTQGVNVRVFLDAAGAEGQAEGALQGRAAHRLAGGGGAQAVVAFAWEQERRMAMSFPEFAQELEGALRQRDVTIGVALAAADVQEHALGVDVADLKIQAFAQAQAAGVDQAQGDPMIQGRDLGENAAHFAGGEDDGQLELGLGADQNQFVRPLSAQGFLPKEFDGTNGLSGGLAGDFLDRLEVDEVLAELFGGEEIGSLAVMLADLDETSVVSLLGALGQGQKGQVIGEGV